MCLKYNNAIENIYDEKIKRALNLMIFMHYIDPFSFFLPLKTLIELPNIYSIVSTFWLKQLPYSQSSMWAITENMSGTNAL